MNILVLKVIVWLWMTLGVPHCNLSMIWIKSLVLIHPDPGWPYRFVRCTDFICPASPDRSFEGYKSFLIGDTNLQDDLDLSIDLWYSQFQILAIYIYFKGTKNMYVFKVLIGVLDDIQGAHLFFKRISQKISHWTFFSTNFPPNSTKSECYPYISQNWLALANSYYQPYTSHPPTPIEYITRAISLILILTQNPIQNQQLGVSILIGKIPHY